MSRALKTIWVKPSATMACAKMFDIPELFHLVCSQLDRHSLAQCAQVNKYWNVVASQHVWRTIPKNMSPYRWYQFRHLVLEDYFNEIRQQEKQHLQMLQRSSDRRRRSSRIGKSVVQPLEPDSLFVCVRQVEDFTQLLRGLQPVLISSNPNMSEYLGPSGMTLARHFLRRCPNVLVHFQLNHEYFCSDERFRCALEILPKVHSLVIKGGVSAETSCPVSRFGEVLCTVSSNLRSLTINVPVFRTGTFLGSFGLTDNGDPLPRLATRPTTLKLHALGERGGSVMSWSWMWRACEKVKDIEIHYLSEDVLESLVHCIPEMMPSLETVTFGASTRLDGWHNREPLENRIASLLAANQNGWKAVQCRPPVNLGPNAMEALFEHDSTLEDVSLGDVRDTPRVLRVLKSCPKLRRFADLDNIRHCHVPLPAVHLTGFVDFDPESARPSWMSSRSLEILSITLDSDPGQLPWDSDQTMRRLCERLGQFTNLKVLHLAHGNCEDGQSSIHAALELTLKSGLDALGGLKNLQELHICKLGHAGLGVEEVKWMVKHWPRLSKICGLGRPTSAYKWLRRNRPRIDVD